MSYLFTLKNINTQNIIKTYLINDDKNINVKKNKDKNEITLQDNSDTIIEKKTLLSELIDSEKSKEFISFLNQIKHTVKCVQVTTEIKENSKIPCFWCRHDFDSIPISCPIKYIPNQAIKHYYSEISRNDYTIKEKVVSNTSKIEKDNIKNLKLYKSGHYIVDGIFCSFNCCKAFINDNRHNNMYDDSDLLLIHLYNDITQSSITKIEPAPHWRLLSNRGGGNLTIEKFREDFGKINYQYHNYVKTIYKPISYLWEERIKF